MYETIYLESTKYKILRNSNLSFFTTVFFFRKIFIKSSMYIF